MIHRIIFVGGVHGVGKTHFCEKLSERFSVEHVSASSLIKRHKRLARNKEVEDVGGNQAILIAELSNYQTNKSTLLLDGHFSLLAKTSEIEDVPLGIFLAISPLAIFLLHDDPLEIAKRLTLRDGEDCKVELIASLQEREVSRAHWVSSELNVPIIRIEIQKNFEESAKSLVPFLVK